MRGPGDMEREEVGYKQGDLTREGIIARVDLAWAGEMVG